jgi:folate-binding protein YgfZ
MLSGSVSHDAYQTARHHAARLDRPERGRIVVSGADRASYLHGLLTNDVASLKAGQGCYAAYLTAQGRMIADLFVYELGDVILLTVPRAETASVLAKLDQFIFSEDVQLGDATDAFVTTAVIGPDAAPIVSGITGLDADTVATLPEHGNRRGQFAGQAVIVTRITDAGEAGYDLYVDTSCADALREALGSAGVPELDASTAEAIRIEAGVPRFGHDMDQETIPLEAGIESRAISFTKGCYVGQEVIIRVMHRGHGRVAKKLVGLRCEGATVPAAGALVTAEGRDIGHVTSAAHSPALGVPIALAYLHRDFLAPGIAVSIDNQPAFVSALPFVPQAQD